MLAVRPDIIVTAMGPNNKSGEYYSIVSNKDFKNPPLGFLGRGHIISAMPEVSEKIDEAGKMILPVEKYIAIGKPLKLSPAFSPLHTVRAAFTAYGVPSLASFLNLNQPTC